MTSRTPEPLPSFDPGFSTPEMTVLFSPESRVRLLLRFESALAEAEAEAGVVPVNAADQIVRACRLLPENPATILAGTWEDGTPLLRLLTHLRSHLTVEEGGWLHYGATTQDAVDTALMLQSKEGLSLLTGSLDTLARRLRELVEAHRDTPMAVRTFLQHAGTTTFGLRAAQWLEPVIRHLEAARSESELLPVQLGGPQGNLRSLGDQAVPVMSGLAERLGLQAPVVAWHTDRSPLVPVVGLVDGIAQTMAKIGTDLAILAQTEIAEVAMRPGGSSSVPGKRNPIDAIRAMAAAAVCHEVSGVLGASRGHELDRGLGGWHAEWVAVPLAFQTAGAAVTAIDRALASLEVDAERMSLNLGESDRAGVEASAPLIDRVLASYDRVLPQQ